MKKYLLLPVLLIIFQHTRPSVESAAAAQAAQAAQSPLDKIVHTVFMFDQDPGSVIINKIKIPKTSTYQIEGIDVMIFPGDSLTDKGITSYGPPALNSWLTSAGTDNLGLKPIQDPSLDPMFPTVTINKHIKMTKDGMIASAGVTFEAILDMKSIQQKLYGYAELDTLALIKYLTQNMRFSGTRQ